MPVKEQSHINGLKRVFDWENYRIQRNIELLSHRGRRVGELLGERNSLRRMIRFFWRRWERLQRWGLHLVGTNYMMILHRRSASPDLAQIPHYDQFSAYVLYPPHSTLH